MRIQTKELTPDLWPDLENLFGPNGACGGCWCQYWHTDKGERWADIKGAVAKERFREGVLAGFVQGILAFVEEKPVGWCALGPRDTFHRLNRARTLKCDDSSEVWSIPCFFVIRGYRRQGVAAALLKHAVKAMRDRGVRIVEGYPSKPDKTGRYIDAFAYTGTQSLFRKAGFTPVGNPEASRQRVRKTFRTGRKMK